MIRVDRNATQILDKARRLEASIEKDIIKALNLRYTACCFSSDPFEMDAGVFHGSISLASSATRQADCFNPSAYEVEATRVEALDLMITQWATVVALRIESNAPEYRQKTNWVKKTNRTESKIVLIDEENGHYYHPVASDLGGDVVPGVPKTGLVAFEPFRQSTAKVQLRIAGARFTAEKFEPELVFRFQSPDLSKEISKELSKPKLEAQIKQAVEKKAGRMQRTIIQEAKKGGGCLILLSTILPLAWWLAS